MARGLGQLTLDLVVKTGAFTSGMTKAERDLNKSLTAMEKRAYKFGQTLGTGIKAGAVIATAALSALAVAVGQQIDGADAMRDLSIRTGVATEKLSEYAYAAKQTGTDIDGLSRGLKLLAKNAAEAADETSGKGKLFEALGVNVKDAEGNLKSLDQLLPEVADKFRALEDGTTKAALAQELFGKFGLEMIEFLNQGSAGLSEMGQKARDLGIIISSDTAAAADEFNDKLADLKAIGSAFALQIAAELLPRLIELVDYFTDAAQEGKVLGTSIADVGAAFDFFAGQIEKANEVGESTKLMFAGINLAVSSLKDSLASLLSFEVGGFIKKMADVQRYASAALFAGFGATSEASKVAASGGRARNARGGSNRTETGGAAQDLALQNRLNGFLSTGGKSPKAGGSGGKSDAEKEAEQLEASYKRLNESMAEQIALFGQTGEAAKVRYDLENGELAKLNDARKETLIGQAEQLDQMELMKELEAAAKKASDEEFESMRKGREETDLLLQDMEFELSLIGKSNEARERAIFLRSLDADATDEQREAAAKLFDEIKKGQELDDFMRDFKEGFADAFVDFASGAKSAKEAFGDFADSIFKRALQFVADKAINAMFDAFNGEGNGAAASGGATSGWGNILSSILGIFGGGKAGGGPIGPGRFYEVNESGMEMATVGGRDYLLTGSRSGTVTAANKLRGVSNTNNFILAAPTSQRTQEQMAQRVGFETSMAQRRNG